MSENVVSLNFRKHGDSTGSLVQKDTVKKAIAWLSSQDKDSFEYVGLCDAKGNLVVGYDEIMRVFKNNSDLFGKEEGCIHPETTCGNGGGIKCTTCSGWFCY